MEVIEKYIEYDPRSEYGITNLSVEGGDLLSIEVKIVKKWRDFYFIPSSLEGFSYPLAFLFPPRWKEQKYYCLCACIGKDEDRFIKIGKGISDIKITKSGELFIFVNDYFSKTTYKNNRGLLNLSIKLTKNIK